VIDIHHHCLPGVDDGPADLDAAVAQCRMAAAEGIETIIATPHRHHPQYDVPPDRARAAHSALVEALAREQVGVRVVLGSEIHYSERIGDGFRSGGLIDLGGNGRWFLFELPSSHVPIHLDRMIFALHLEGFYPVLAHPERNDELADDAGKMEKLRGQGVLVQITAQSILGEFGRSATKASEKWLKSGLVDFIATDAHDVRRRPPLLRDALLRARALAGDDAVRRMTVTNPGLVLAGSEIS
jgi:protein-tyrosine phosphatase